MGRMKEMGEARRGMEGRKECRKNTKAKGWIKMMKRGIEVKIH